MLLRCSGVSTPQSGGCDITTVVSIDAHQNQIPACSSMQSCKMTSMHCRAMPAVRVPCDGWKVHHAVPDQGQHTHQSTSDLSPEGCRRRTLNMKFAMAPVTQCSNAEGSCYGVAVGSRREAGAAHADGRSPPTIVTLLSATALLGWKSAARVRVRACQCNRLSHSSVVGPTSMPS